MNKIKKVLGMIILTAALVLNLSLPALAAASDTDTASTGTIIIQNDTTETHVSIAGRTYTAYKVFDLTQNEDHTAYSYTLSDDFKGLFTSNDFKTKFPSATVDESKTSTIYSFVSGLTTAADIEKFAGVVYTFATANGLTGIQKTASAVVENGAATQIETAVFDELALGYYMIYGEGVSLDNQKTVVTACVLDTTTWDADEEAYTVTINVKVGIPTVEKKIVENSGLVDAASASIGDTIKFRVTSNVPDLTGYTAYTFKMTDTMSKGLTFDDSSLVVKIGTDVISNPDEGDKLYTVNAKTDGTTGETTLTVEFADFYNLIKNNSYTKGTAITFEYSAVLNGNAIIAAGANPNTVKITYSSDPYNSTTNDTIEDTVKVYTFKLNIYKYTNHGTSNTALAGAEFEIKKGTETIKFVEANGKYRVAAKTDTDTVSTVASDSTGYIYIEGLGEGEYTLTETKAPDGYNLLEADISVKIEPEYDSTNTTEFSQLKTPDTDASYKLLDDKAGIQADVENNTGAELPSTGGMGTTILYIIGGFLIAIAVIGFTVKKIGRKE